MRADPDIGPQDVANLCSNPSIPRPGPCQCRHAPLARAFWNGSQAARRIMRRIQTLNRMVRAVHMRQGRNTRLCIPPAS